MDQAKEEALRNHPAFAASQLKALFAKEALKETQSAFYPFATGYVDAVDTAWDNTRILAGGLNNPSVYDRVGEGISVSQTITDFGKTRNRSKGAQAELRAADAGAEASREQVLLNVEANYLAALQAKAVLAVSSQTVESRRLLVEQVGTLANHQLRSDLDVSFAQVSLEQAELLFQKSEGDLESAMASLGDALGRKDVRLFTLVDDRKPAESVADLSELVLLALNHRPELLQLHYQRDAYYHLAESAKDANYPTLAAVGVIGNTYAADVHLPDKYAAAGIQLTVPIFEGGALIARQRQQEILARIADQTLREAEDKVVREVRIARASVQTSIQRLSTTRQLLKHATEAFELSQSRYKAGSASIVELSEAELNQTAAAIAYANADYDTQIQEALLAFEIGGLQ